VASRTNLDRFSKGSHHALVTMEELEDHAVDWVGSHLEPEKARDILVINLYVCRRNVEV